MKKFKEFIKWTDVALSLRELFHEVKETLKEHEKEFNDLHKKNLLLLQQLQFQKEIMDDLRKRIEILESRGRTIVDEDQKELHSERRQLPFDPEN